jgi:putative FmdB family regulatory protein
MPLYAFFCGTCKQIEERLQVGYEPVVPRCEKCGVWMQLSINTPAVVLKGAGWAKKDRRKKK